MVRQFSESAWVTQSKQAVISCSVTSCAGMTAFVVIVAQTKVGFLSRGRGQKFRELFPEGQIIQVEGPSSQTLKWKTAVRSGR